MGAVIFAATVLLIGCGSSAGPSSAPSTSQPLVSPPSISSISPTSGPTSGGTTVTIIGANFQKGATVTFGGVAATSVTFASSTKLTATSPKGNAGTAAVVVTNPDGQNYSLTSGFTYTNQPPASPPSISSISPTSGPTSGGTTVTITGANFQKGATVTFGGVPATSVTFASSTQLAATSPNGNAGTVAVVVTNPDGQTDSLASGFTYTNSGSGGGGGGLSGTPGATATQYVLTYTASTNMMCTIEVSQNQSFTPLVHAVDPSIFPGSDSDGQTNIGQRTFVVGAKTILQEEDTPPSVTLGAGACSRSGSRLVTCSVSSQPFVAGDNITVTGMSNSAYDDPWARIDVATPSSLSYEVLTSGTDTGGGGTVTRADRYSLALQAATAYYYRIGGASNTCGADPTTGTFTTMTVPDNNTFAEVSVQDANGNQLTPTVLENRNWSTVDPLTGVLVSRLSLYSDTNGYIVGSQSGQFRPCSLSADSKGYYHCGIAMPNGGTMAMYAIKDSDSTGSPIFLGEVNFHYIDSGGHNDYASATPYNGNFDPTDANVLYGIAATNGGYSPNKPVIVKLTYTGNDAPAASGADAALTVTALTPDPSNTLNDQLNAYIQPWHPSFKADEFAGCDIVEADKGASDTYLYGECLSGDQGSMAWDWVYDVNSGAIVAAMPTYANANNRWCGTHGANGSNSADWYLLSDSYLGTPGAGDWTERLTSAVAATATSFTVDGWQQWTASTSYQSPGAIRDSNGNWEIATTGGTSGSAAPAWNQTPGGTTADGTVTWTNEGAVADTPDPQNFYPLKDRLGKYWSELQSAQPGDYFQFQDGSGEIIQILSVSGGTWTIARGADGTTASAHNAGATLTTICPPAQIIATSGQGGYQASIWWNWPNDPHGTDTTRSYVVPFGRTVGHGFNRYPYVVDGGSVYNYGTLTSSIISSGVPSFNTYGRLMFAGIYTDQPGSTAQGYQTWDFENASDRNSFINDFYFLGGDTFGCFSQVAGTSYIYKLDVTSTKCNSNGDVTFNPALPYIGMSGTLALKDISAPGSALTDTTADNDKFCIAHVAGECWAGSSVGDIYGNFTALDSGIGNACTAQNENTPYTGRDWCLFNGAMYGSAINEVGFSPGNPIPNVTQFGASATDAKYSRRLVQTMWGPQRTAAAHMHTVPGGNHIFFESCIADPHLAQDAFRYNDPYGCQEFMALIPPEPTQDGIDRTNFETVSIPIGTATGATQARLKWGYEENGPNNSFYCTQYKATCYWNGSALSPSYDPSTFMSLPLNTTESFAIGDPQRVIFYQIDYLDSSNNVVSQGPVTAAAVP